MPLWNKMFYSRQTAVTYFLIIFFSFWMWTVTAFHSILSLVTLCSLLTRLLAVSIYFSCLQFALWVLSSPCLLSLFCFLAVSAISCCEEILECFWPKEKSFPTKMWYSDMLEFVSRSNQNLFSTSLYTIFLSICDYL